ncbi:hypothetical protein GPECTOR_19g222 [Gonium pectorale]|uniref:Uncharacterized protein n=1 Tax=Gonium pectorale TaxID=33097 RepID=A0A150GIZ4_GONPE|nr:hypothetical protein GPECTOR_19g222 [Gonium pectorale]|eukprot:KXZ49771.1 hypothetical protein GPECTOR_19g222 [Gonium pectorale]
MAEAAKGALQALKRVLYSVGIKEPWKMTGVRSLPDYEHYMPMGLEYRKFSPGTQPVKAVIPHDSPRLVYDIKYFVRDYRRNNKYTMRQVDTKIPFDFEKLFAAAPLKPEEVKFVPRPAVMPTRGF